MFLSTEVITSSGVKASDEIKDRLTSHCEDTHDAGPEAAESAQLADVGLSKTFECPPQLPEIGRSEALVRLGFMDMLPTQMKVVLASLDTLSLETQEEEAVKMLEQVAHSGVFVVSGESYTPAAQPIRSHPVPDRISQIADQSANF